MAEIKEILSTAQTKMQKTIEVLRVDLAYGARRPCQRFAA